MFISAGDGPRRQLELQAHAIDDQFLAGPGDVNRGRDQGLGPGADRLADSGGDLAARTFGQQGPELIGRPTGHGRTGDDVLADRMVHKAGRRDDVDPPGVNIGLGDDAAHAAKVIGVAVGVDHRHHRPRAQLGVGQLQRRLGDLHRGQGVDDDPASLAGDEGDVGDVKTAHLPDPVHDLVEAVPGQQLGLAPEAGVGAGRGGGPEEVIGRQVPDHMAIRRQDPGIGAGGDEAPVGEVEILATGEIRAGRAGGRDQSQRQAEGDQEPVHVCVLPGRTWPEWEAIGNRRRG